MELTTARLDIAKLYLASFNRVADATGLDYWTTRYMNGETLSDIAQLFTGEPEYQAQYPAIMTNGEYVTAIYSNVFGRTADPVGQAHWEGMLTSGTATKATLMNWMVSSALNDDALRLANQAEFAVQSVLQHLDPVVTSAQLVDITADPATIQTALTGSANGQTFTLTTNVDSGAAFTGTTGNDTFTASYNTTAAVHTLGGLDILDGGEGTDTLAITDDSAGGFTLSTTAQISNIENMTVRADGAVITNVSGTNVSGLNSIAVTTATTANVTAATTTAVSVSGITGASTVAGGSTQTVTSVGQATLSGAVGAINATVSAAGTAATSIQGGTSVNLTVTGLTDDAASVNITVGGTTAPTGAVVINATSAYDIDDDADLAMGNIAVTGGSTVSITQSVATAAVKADALEDDDANTVTQGDVSVTGGSATTAVTVTQDAAITAVDYDDTTDPITDGVLGVVNGAVTIADKNAASTTLAGTIATVSLNNYGASTIDSSALTTVDLQGTGGTLGISRGGLTATPTANTLAINTTSAAIAAITDSEAAASDDGFTTINLTNSGTSTVANLTAADATALTVAGTGALTFTAAALLANVTSVNVTNTGSTTFGTTTLNVASTFTSGAGAETVILGAATLAVSTGAGDDTVTVGASAITGTVDAGDGTADTLIMTDANAVTATATDTFEGKISNFERLSLTGTTDAAQTVNLANLDNINYVSLAAVNVGRILTLSNVTSGVTVNANTGAAGTIDVTQATNGVADTINFGVSNTTAKTVFKLDASEYETIAITTDDSATTATSIAHIITTLDATAATALTITGDAGLTVGTLTGTALTSINASNVTAGAVTFTTGALAAASTINGGAGNDVISAANALAAVTLNGNAGNDTLTGGTVADTINGGAGADIIDGKAGADSLTGGTGRDIFNVSTVTDSNGVNVDSVTDMVSGTDFLSAGNNQITYVGEASSYGTVLTSLSGVAYQAVMDTSTKTVYIDVDGSQTLDAADIAITTNISDLSQADFAMLGTSGNNTLTGTAGQNNMFGNGGNDAYTIVDNTAALATISTDTFSIATTGMDIVHDASASDTINLTSALETEANYDNMTIVAAGGAITTALTANAVKQFTGLYDYTTGIFTSSATTAAASASTTDVAANMYFYATADATNTVATDAVIVLGVAAQLTGACANGIITLA